MAESWIVFFLIAHVLEHYRSAYYSASPWFELDDNLVENTEQSQYSLYSYRVRKNFEKNKFNWISAINKSVFGTVIFKIPKTGNFKTIFKVLNWNQRTPAPVTMTFKTFETVLLIFIKKKKLKTEFG